MMVQHRLKDEWAEGIGQRFSTIPISTGKILLNLELFRMFTKVGRQYKKKHEYLIMQFNNDTNNRMKCIIIQYIWGLHMTGFEM